MSATDSSAANLTAFAKALRDNLAQVLLGKPEAVRIVAAATLAGGHVLLEDDPGVGKTVLAKAVARSLDVSFARVQGTVDLLPSDITGVSVFDPVRVQWDFRPGPLFHHVLLLDEINRATPRAQSALLEAMAEGQVSVDGVSRPLPFPFLVLATQNPVGDVGTFALPAGQRDRFSVLVSLGAPDRDTERRVLEGEGGQRGISAIHAVGGPREWAEAQRAVDDVFVSPLVVEYVLDVLAASRQHPDVSEGASPRAGLALLRISRALAALDDRTFVLPDDVKAAAPAVLAHRLGWKGFARSGVAHSLVDEVVRTVRVPVP